MGRELVKGDDGVLEEGMVIRDVAFIEREGVPQYHLDKKKVENKKKGHSL